jgi:hypothetical protein
VLARGETEALVVRALVGLSRADRDAFRAALDAADATRAEHSVV